MDLDTLRAICLAHAGATEEVQWGDHLLFKAGGKMFCITSLSDANDSSFKVPDEDFEALCSGEIFRPAPHLARAKWVKVIAPKYLKQADWKQYITASYDLVVARLSKKLKASLAEKTNP